MYEYFGIFDGINLGFIRAYWRSCYYLKQEAWLDMYLGMYMGGKFERYQACVKFGNE